MEFADVLRRRHMVRNFEPDPLPLATLERILDAARRAPSAGNTQGTDLLLLEGPEQTGRYWDVTLPLPRRRSFRWPGLLQAPVLIVPLASSGAYLRRYAEPDKAASGLGLAEDRWPVPYWFIDTAMAVMAMLLTATDEGLGALFFGIFNNEAELMETFGVPPTHQPIGTLAVGYPAPDKPSRSAARPRRPLDEIVHRGRW
ncbi:MAG: nitroreductase family protein [Acidimicrobiales bacterium]|nr:nitroreductase family protein [Acidimicrobiales bacterium]